MPNNVRISRDPGCLPGKTRAELVFGDVFSYTGKDSKPKKEKFIALGASDRFYSVKLSNGELSGADLEKGAKPVSIVGVSEVHVKRFRKAESARKDFRAQLRMNDLFQVNKDGSTYLHLGRLNDQRFFALNIESEDYATTDGSDKEVYVVGYGEFHVRHV